jgi:hypothetical protein
VRLIVVKREGKVKRAPKGRQRPRAWREGRLTPWQEGGGQPRWPKKRMQHGIKKALPPYPDGPWYHVTRSGVGQHARELRVDVEWATMPETTLWDGL